MPTGRYFYKEGTVYAIVSLWYNVRWLYLDKPYKIMEILLTDAKKVRKGFKNVNF
jgi:hypothetical protein